MPWKIASVFFIWIMALAWPSPKEYDFEDVVRRLEIALGVRPVDRAEYAAPHIEQWQKITISSTKALEPGDVLLYRERNLISQGTGGGPYYHASLYIGQNQVAEMQPQGGRIATITNLSDIDVFRHRNRESATAAAQYARDNVQTLHYDQPGIGTFLPVPGFGHFYQHFLQNERRAICSEFVNACLAYIGIPIVDKQKFLTSVDNPFHKVLVAPNYLGYALGEFGQARDSFQQRRRTPHGMEVLVGIANPMTWSKTYCIPPPPPPSGYALAPPGIGGVSLQMAEEKLAKMAWVSLAGIAYDQRTDEFILLTREDQAIAKGSSMRMDDFIVALQIAYGKRAILLCSFCEKQDFECCSRKNLLHRYLVKEIGGIYHCQCCGREGRDMWKMEMGPAVTIDPWPGNPYGPQMVVRLIGGIENSNMGKTIFEGDHYLKWLSVGCNDAGKSFDSRVPCYANMAVLLTKCGRIPGAESWNRFWIQPQEIVSTQTAVRNECGGMLDLAQIRMCVKTENMCLTSKGLKGLGKTDPAAEEFARHFTDHYEEFAKEFSIFADVKEQAKWVAIACWLRQQNIPIDTLFLENYQFQNSVSTPTTTPSVSNSYGNVRVFGGVRLDLEPNQIKMLQTRPDMLNLVKQARPNDNDRIWRVDIGQKKATAMAFSLSSSSANTTIQAADLLIPDEHFYIRRQCHQNLTGSTDLGHAWYIPVSRLVFQNTGQATSIIQFGNIQVARRPAELFDLHTGERIAFADIKEGRETRFMDGQMVHTNYLYYASPSSPLQLRIESGPSYRLIYSEGLNVGREMLFGPEGNLLLESYADGSEMRYQYDSDHHLAHIDTSSRSVSFEYDKAGRISQITCQSQGRSYSLKYEYNSHQDLVAVWDGQGHCLHRYQYDRYHQLQKIDSDYPHTKLDYGRQKFVQFAEICQGNHRVVTKFSRDGSLQKIAVFEKTPEGQWQYDIEPDGFMSRCIAADGRELLFDPAIWRHRHLENRVANVQTDGRTQSSSNIGTSNRPNAVLFSSMLRHLSQKETYHRKYRRFL